MTKFFISFLVIQFLFPGHSKEIKQKASSYPVIHKCLARSMCVLIAVLAFLDLRLPNPPLCSLTILLTKGWVVVTLTKHIINHWSLLNQCSELLEIS